ncbi:MAG TPA: hypothetical protein VF595_14750 [Tepidisphaeraceae bacterium]|jgi:DNA-directed RNA polymerase specialized sigma24 family protein
MQQVFDLETQKIRPRESPATLRATKAWHYLRPADRTILEMVERGLSHRLIGQAVGVNAGTISRRLALIRSRLQTPLARCCLDPTTPLPADARESALLHSVAGLSVREIARTRCTSASAVTDHVRFAQGVARGVSARR